LLAFALPGNTFASVDRLDNAPGATLLLPHFIVDADDDPGAGAITNTRFTVGNTSESSKVARVTLWTNMGVSTLAFNVHLNGHDEVEIDLRQLFRTGRVAETGTGVGPAGNLAQPEQAAPGCDPVIGGEIMSDPALRSGLIGAHRGNLGLDDMMCGGLSFGDGLLRGYATVDVVNECPSAGISGSWSNGTAITPESAGYFVNGGNGVAANDNVLFGRFATIESDGGVGGELVSLQADAVDTRTSTPGEYTFYGSFVGFTAADNREPLGGIWQARTLTGGLFETELVAWRDPKQVTPPFVCGGTPSWFPLSQNEAAWADEQENFFFFGDDIFFPNIPPPEPLIFPFVSSIADPAELSPFPFGFVQLNLNSTIFGQTPGSAPDLSQSWVGIRIKEFAGDPSRNFSDQRPATMLIPLWQLDGAFNCSQNMAMESECLPFRPSVKF